MPAQFHLLERPAPGAPIPGPIRCKMRFHGSERYRDRATVATDAGGGTARSGPDDPGAKR